MTGNIVSRTARKGSAPTPVTPRGGQDPKSSMGGLWTYRRRSVVWSQTVRQVVCLRGRSHEGIVHERCNARSANARDESPLPVFRRGVSWNRVHAHAQTRLHPAPLLRAGWRSLDHSAWLGWFRRSRAPAQLRRGRPVPCCQESVGRARNRGPPAGP